MQHPRTEGAMSRTGASLHAREPMITFVAKQRAVRIAQEQATIASVTG